MATGIVSVAAERLGLDALAKGLFALNALLFAALVVVSIWRVVRFPAAVVDDAANPVRAAGFFTFVAALCVLGVQSTRLGHAPRVGKGFFVAATVSLAVVFYGFFATRIVMRPKTRRLEGEIDGSWLVSIVALHTVAVLAMTLPHAPLAALGLGLSLVGSALYVPLITFLIYRLLFVPLRAEAFQAPYWVNMGALASATLAGALVVLHAPETPLFQALVPFMHGVSFLFWAVASAWVPLLVLLEGWRYGGGRVKWRYDASLWDIVFPLGMYAVASEALGRALGVDALQSVARVAALVAIIVWGVVGSSALFACAGVIATCRKRSRPSPR